MNGLFGLLTLILLIFMARVKVQNQKDPLKKHKITPLKAQLIGIIVFGVVALFFSFDPGFVISKALNAFGAGILYFIIFSIYNLFTKKSNFKG